MAKQQYFAKKDCLFCRKKMVELDLKSDEVTEENFSKYLYQPDLPERTCSRDGHRPDAENIWQSPADQGRDR